MLQVSVAKHLLRPYSCTKNYFNKNYDKTIYMHSSLNLFMISARRYYFLDNL